MVDIRNDVLYMIFFEESFLNIIRYMPFEEQIRQLPAEYGGVAYGVESVPKITGVRGPPAFRRSPTFSRPPGFRVLDISDVNALSVPNIRFLRGPPTFQGNLFSEAHIAFIVLEGHLMIYYFSFSA